MKIHLSLLASACALAYPLVGQAQTAHGGTELEQVVVTATRQPVMASETLANVDVITREEIANAGNTSLVDLLSARSGIQVSSTGGPGANTSVFIRGANAGHTLVLVDGMRVGSATTGEPALETIPLALIDHVEILRGPASALYGSDAIGGVIQIFTRKGREGYQPSLRVGFGTDNSRELEAAMAGGVDRLRYSVIAGQARTDGFNARTGSTAGRNRDDDGFRNDYVNGSVSLGIGERDELGLSVMHSNGRNWYDAGYAFDSSISKQTDSASAHLRKQLTADWASTVRLGYSANQTHASADGVSNSRFDTDQTQFTWQNDVALGGGALLAAYEYLEQKVDTTTDYAKTKRSSNSLVLGWGGQFGLHHMQFNARHDNDSQFGDKTTGSAAYGYQFHPEWRVQGSIGTAFKAPTFNDLYYPLECYPGYGCFGGNDKLKPEDALNRELGVVWERGATRANVTYFNNRVKNLIDWSSGIADNVATATLEGVELGLNTMVGAYRLRASVDFLEAKDKDSGDYLGRRARHAATIGIDRSMGAWSWGAELTGQGRRFDKTANTAANKLGGYALLNAYVHYAVARDWSMELRANNILDKDYERAQGYGTGGTSAFVSLRYALH